MKRSKYLETLSWEHHNGLVLSYRLKKGMELNVPIEELKNYLLYLWTNSVSHHFKHEEQHLAVMNEKIKDRELLDRMLKEHREFYRLIESLSGETDDNNKKKLIEEFTANLEAHIRFEERELFPFIEQHFPESKLASIGRILHKYHKPVDMSWENEFWKEVKTRKN